MVIAVIGANGQLGTDICKIFSQKFQVMELNHDDVEISDYDRLRQVLCAIKPDMVINTAAYHNVLKCEENPLISFKINGLGAKYLAELSNKFKFRLVQYSTDYVFDGSLKRPYNEEDKTNPLNIYALTKLAGENLIINNCSDYYVIRISGLYGSTPCRAKRGNFVTTMLKLAKEKSQVKVVDDEILTPTSTEEIAKNTLLLCETDAYGIYHMTCEGSCSWYEFAKVIFTTMKFKTPLYACKSSEFPSPVKRPSYSVLENKNLKSLSKNIMPHWKDALVKFLTENYL